MDGFGTCPCGGKYENHSIKVTLNVNDQSIVLDPVPQGVCPNCGSRVYTTETLELIEKIIKSTPDRP
ncbi:MAG TPA: YgiT-type zinc finger protein [Anaerolineaceae bacterium]|nr:YgiT-type zinc finger protein [Anaerolineaceae bacterium]